MYIFLGFFNVEFQPPGVLVKLLFIYTSDFRSLFLQFPIPTAHLACPRWALWSGVKLKGYGKIYLYPGANDCTQTFSALEDPYVFHISYQSWWGVEKSCGGEVKRSSKPHTGLSKRCALGKVVMLTCSFKVWFYTWVIVLVQFYIFNIFKKYV